MEAWQLDNSDELLTDAIYKSAVAVSETGEEINTVSVKVHQTLQFQQLNQIQTQM